MVKKIIVILALSGLAQAADKTPYNFGFGGNGYSGTTRYSPTWLAERYDLALNGTTLWPGLYDSMYDTAQSWTPAKHLILGPYASTQELNLYTAGWTTSQYAARIADPDPFWMLYYAQHYMDSIEVSVESLYVHYDDDTVNITNTDGTRGYNINALSYRRTRFSYQYWGNNATDTFMYPGGYCWLANGYNADARKALAYAYRRYFIEDSATYGPGGLHWNGYFSDNQGRAGTMPRLSAYYTINYTSGGPYVGMDWVEQGNIQSGPTELLKYYDSSTLMIDRVIDSVLNIACAAAGFSDSIVRFANVDKSNVGMTTAQIKHTSLMFEYSVPAGAQTSPTEDPNINGQAWGLWRNQLRMADSVQNRNDDAGPNRRLAMWEARLNLQCSTNPAHWHFDSSRVYYAGYAFWLTLQEDNCYYSPCQFNDYLRWRKIYEVDLGTRIDATFDTTNSTGSGDYGTLSKVIQCKYLHDGDSAIVLFRTSYSNNPNCATDSILVSLGAYYYQIDANADTSGVAVTQIYLKPSQGWIGIQGAPPAEQPPTISSIGPSSGYRDSTSVVTGHIDDDEGTTHVWSYVWNTTSDSIGIADSTLAAPSTSFTYAHNYTWLDSGYYYIVYHAADGSGASDTTKCSTYTLINVAPAPSAKGLKIKNTTIDGTKAGG
jgi:hypothetical protein